MDRFTGEPVSKICRTALVTRELEVMLADIAEQARNIVLKQVLLQWV